MKSVIDGLLSPNVYDHPVKYFEVIETHISHVVLTGEFAYKIKKPVKYDFLDYTTLDLRRLYCEKECTFNAPLAAEVYLEVVTINQLPNGKLKINGEGPVIEYALKMREFQQSQLFDFLLKNLRVDEYHFELIAERIARYYQHIESATVGTAYATPEIVVGHAIANFHEAYPFLTEEQDLAQLTKLEEITASEGKRLHNLFLQRKEKGFVKPCHGDLHLGNIALLKDIPVIFDCIEFNELFRWTDTMADIGFLMMDLYFRGHPDIANHFLNSYLTCSGDFEGLQVLPFYTAYRSMVRAKIQLFETQNERGRDNEILLRDYRHYADIAERFLSLQSPSLLIMHGLSGSGKTTLAQELSSLLQAIHLRADIERKRLFALQPTDRVSAEEAAIIYSAEASIKTYNQLAKLATIAIKAGFPVIIDATFLQQSHRATFRKLAEELEVPFTIISCAISQEHAQAYIAQRIQENKDASDATIEVLSQQLVTQEALSSTELLDTVIIDRDTTTDISLVYKQVTHKITQQEEVLLEVK